MHAPAAVRIHSPQDSPRYVVYSRPAGDVKFFSQLCGPGVRLRSVAGRGSCTVGPGGGSKRQFADGLPICHRQSLRPCRCHPFQSPLLCPTHGWGARAEGIWVLAGIFFRQDWGGGAYRTPASLSRQERTQAEAGHFPIKTAGAASKTRPRVQRSELAGPVARRAGRPDFRPVPGQKEMPDKR